MVGWGDLLSSQFQEESASPPPSVLVSPSLLTMAEWLFGNTFLHNQSRHRSVTMEEARGAAAACQPERLRATLLDGGRKEETQEIKAEMSDGDRIRPRALLLLQLSIMEATLERQPPATRSWIKTAMQIFIFGSRTSDIYFCPTVSDAPFISCWALMTIQERETAAKGWGGKAEQRLGAMPPPSHTLWELSLTHCGILSCLHLSSSSLHSDLCLH